MGDIESWIRQGWTGTIEELSRRRIILNGVLFERFGSMPDRTHRQRYRRMLTFARYYAKYPHGIPHPEFFEE